ncbi:MAG: hypothetical protein IJA14_01550 [Alphaproteobacteria bacterium]|nr:hypothetical protein [Alphaproteobacteria bacterium]
MGNKKDVLPIIMASAVALVVTGIVRWILPGGTVIKQQPLQKELSLPNIPLMIKEEKKKIMDVQVLVTSSAFKKDEKIVVSKLSWKQWPISSLMPYFIARDLQGTPLNNGADYANIQKMWAKSDIPEGIPMIMNMATSEDPVERERRAKAKEAAERQKNEKKKVNQERFIRPGYRAITFQVDQRSPTSYTMLMPGDYIDVIINEMNGQKTKTHTYRCLKLIAVDGSTKPFSKDDQSIFSLGSNNPKNVTLEIKEKNVDVMMRQSRDSGVILSLRNQDEKEDHPGEEEGSAEDTLAKNSFMQGILNMNEASSTAILEEARQQKQQDDKSFDLLIRNMDAASRSSTEILEESKTPQGQSLDMMKTIDIFSRVSDVETDRMFEKSSNPKGKYEVASGRIIGAGAGTDGEDKNIEIKIHRALKPTSIQIDKYGNIMQSSSSGVDSTEMGFSSN